MILGPGKNIHHQNDERRHIQSGVKINTSKKQGGGVIKGETISINI